MFVRSVCCGAMLAVCALALLAVPLVAATATPLSAPADSLSSTSSVAPLATPLSTYNGFMLPEGELADEDIIETILLDKEFQQAKERAEQAGEAASEEEASLGLLSSEEESLSAIPSSSRYDSAVSNRLFWLSATAYCKNKASISSWSCSSCRKFGAFHTTAVVENKSNQAFVGWFKGGLTSSPIPGYGNGGDPFVVLSFRGTNNLKNWIQDLKLAKSKEFTTEHKGVKVHTGFFQAWQNVKGGLMPGLKSALSASGAKTIVMVGHSLGGAMAQLAALDLKLHHYKNLKFASYTMGAPRVGNTAWRKLFTSQIDASFREVHQADVVVHLPPKMLGFEHEPLEVFFDSKWKTYKTCTDNFPGESKKCSNKVLLPVSVTDHTHYRGVSVGGYCNSVKLSAEQEPIAEENGEEIDQMLDGLLRQQQVAQMEQLEVESESEVPLSELESDEMEQIIRGLSVQQRLEQQEAEEEEQISRGLLIQQRLEMQEETELITRGLAMHQRLEMQEAEEQLPVDLPVDLPVLAKLAGLKHRRISLNIDIDLE